MSNYHFRAIYGKIYFHPPDQYLSLNGRMGYKILKGDYVEAMLNYHEYRMLEKDNPNYDPEATDQNKYRTTCNPGLYDNCMYDTLKDDMLNGPGCTVPYIRDVENMICTGRCIMIKTISTWCCYLATRVKKILE